MISWVDFFFKTIALKCKHKKYTILLGSISHCSSKSMKIACLITSWLNKAKVTKKPVENRYGEWEKIAKWRC